MNSIKMVADITDKKTYRIIEKIWQEATPKQQKSMLESMGHSDKWVGMRFSDLTGDIQSKIVMRKISF
jgi:hypothetical protein